jgi:hypothetical protein
VAGWLSAQVETHISEGAALINLSAFLNEIGIYSRKFPTQRPKLNSITLYFRIGWRRWCIGSCHINIYNSSASSGLSGFAIFQIVINYMHNKMVPPPQISSRLKVLISFKRDN